jgi:hypothetical protein
MVTIGSVYAGAGSWMYVVVAVRPPDLSRGAPRCYHVVELWNARSSRDVGTVCTLMESTVLAHRRVLDLPREK